MKRFLILALAIPLSVGCAKSTAPTPPTAPGYTNAVDQSLGETLAAARAFYTRLQTDAAAGTFKPSAAETSALNDLGTAINVAEPIYLAYHAGTATQAAAQQAVNNVITAQSAAQSQVSQGGK
jgi:hypothetical protein